MAKQAPVTEGLTHNDTHAKRDSFRSRRGFILACIGSAVGMGNIWLFPTRVSAYGGGTFLVPYLIFVVLIASTGVMGEMAFGRATHSGPAGAFGFAIRERFGAAREKYGRALGLFPVISSLAMAIGYTVVVGWILFYAVQSITGGMVGMQSAQEFGGLFEGVAADNTLWQVAALIIAFGIVSFGIGRGIESANKVMMPLFFLLFVVLAVYAAMQPGSSAGYAYLFTLDPAGLADPMVWVFALGQAFFSLSVAGSGTLIYGSYLSDKEDIPNSAKYVAIFDTLAAILASLVIIPAMASAGQTLSSGGPGLLFIYLPTLFAGMPMGNVVMVIFFVAVLFGGLSSLINLYEAPIATLQERFKLKRTMACLIIGIIGLVVSLVIQQIVSPWMDVCSVYLCPIGAAMAGIMFFWLLGGDFVKSQMNKGRKKLLSPLFFSLGKYVYCFVTLFVLIAGSILGGIG
ncbi:sodium-dependent tryptophan transporter [Denitrobacterium detoxificans]|uniref:Neurotransmitter:Na+ symporter, NSS family n=1 Tax=Denitrobacterium detoxificans TaxID=79604 RepID=A0A172RZN6_9ACTN|nr:sodium-dependent transporter [Denitrobacterium detoxificans]ANE23197.1 sodium-dependent tryptophan transporter [Denitrobacterium detoxificans]SEO56914.1 neurotransmitter:Na+ symporter, NSS family [Denitrobacterium detoxificans]